MPKAAFEYECNQNAAGKAPIEEGHRRLGCEGELPAVVAAFRLRYAKPNITPAVTKRYAIPSGDDSACDSLMKLETPATARYLARTANATATKRRARTARPAES